MLTRLSVSNFAIIDELHLQFGKGLTIITGETGAGKSILIGALKLVLGERADIKQLNDPEKKSIIEAVFDISNLNLIPFFQENELDYEAETILRRELLPSGKSRAFINDTPVTLDILQELSQQFIDIHSQFSSENLLDENYQMKILDAYAQQISEVDHYRQIFSQRNLKKTELKKLEDRLHTKSQESDYQNYLLNELIEANLKNNELEELEQEQNELQHIDEIQKVLGDIYGKLEAPEFGIFSQLNEVTTAINRISEYGGDLSSLADRINSTKIELQDIQNEIQSKISRVELNPERLDEVNERLNLLNNLMAKHRVNSTEELISVKTGLEKETSDFGSLETQIENLQTEIVSMENELKSISQKLSRRRNSVIKEVEDSLLATLSKLGMGNSSIQIRLNSKEIFLPNGSDEIDILFTANKGSSLKPIGKSVSGGERSRLMLSIKKILSTHLQLPTLILDEVDTGVSGKVADEVGNLMQEMAKQMQLLSITHLPQVAAKGQYHFKVMKKTEDNFTRTIVKELDQAERVLEIAELISGSLVSETALEQARSLIEHKKTS